MSHTFHRNGHTTHRSGKPPLDNAKGSPAITTHVGEKLSSSQVFQICINRKLSSFRCFAFSGVKDSTRSAHPPFREHSSMIPTNYCRHSASCRILEMATCYLHSHAYSFEQNIEERAMNASLVAAVTSGQILGTQQVALSPSATSQTYGTYPTFELCQTDELLVYESV